MAPLYSSNAGRHFCISQKAQDRSPRRRSELASDLYRHNSQLPIRTPGTFPGDFHTETFLVHFRPPCPTYPCPPALHHAACRSPIHCHDCLPACLTPIRQDTVQDVSLVCRGPRPPSAGEFVGPTLWAQALWSAEGWGQGLASKPPPPPLPPNNPRTSRRLPLGLAGAQA